MMILIDDDGHARLSGFSSLTILPDIPRSTTSATPRWMAPELLDPEPFCSHNTRESDCYSLGMVIYEVLSGEAPFSATHHIHDVISDIIAGVRPGRPQGTQGIWFTDSLWELLDLCWRKDPAARPPLTTVLRCLQNTTQMSNVIPVVNGNADAGARHKSNGTLNGSGTFSFSFLPQACC